jgi:hypothetical protein
MPRLRKTVLAVLVAILATAAATATADAATTGQLLTHAKRALRGTPGAPNDVTPLLKELSTRLPHLHGTERRQAERLLARPTDGSADPQGNGYALPEASGSPSCSAHFCVHWVASGDDAPDLTDSNGDGVPDYVESALQVAEYSYTVENGQLGWRPPKGDGTLGGEVDKTDIYLKQLGGTGIYGYTAPDPGQQLTATDHSQYAYLVIDNDFRKSEFTPYDSPLVPLEVTIAHEYNHVLQFNIDSFQDTWMFESTAVWMEGKVYPQVLDYLQYLRGWVELTALPLTTFNGANPNDRNNVKVYGSSVWNKWLDAQFGPDLIRQAWENSLLTRRKSFAVEAYDKAIRAQPAGGTFESRFDLFATKTAEWQSRDSGFPEGSHYPDVVRAGRVKANGPGGTVKLNHTTYALIDVRPEAFSRIKVGAVAPSGTNAAVALIGRIGGLPGGTTVISMKKLPKGGPGSVTIQNPGRFSRLTAVLVNSDFEVSGSSPLTGDWTYRRDSQPYYARVSTDFTAPRVVRVVGARKQVRLTFSEAVRGVSPSSVRLVGPGGHAVKSSVRLVSNGRVAVLTPHPALRARRRYRVQALPAVTDISVNPLRTFSATFTTKR